MLGSLFVFASTLTSANGMIIGGSNRLSGGRHQISSSVAALHLKHGPLYDNDDEEAFRNLYREQSAEGVSLGKEFEERQAKLESDRKRLAETFNIDAGMNSANLFNTANAVVMSTPSIRQGRTGRRSSTTTPAVNEDNWALILCTSLTTQLSQQAAVLQDLYPQYPQQQMQRQQTAVIFACALASLMLAGSGGYLDLFFPTAQSQIPSPNSFDL